jgi:proteic killer suppression protein
LIRSIRGTATRQFVETGKSKFSGLDAAIARRRLAVLDSASSPQEFGPLKSVGLHRLTGDRKDFWAVTINGPWRLVFRFEDGHAWDVEIVDYH